MKPTRTFIAIDPGKTIRQRIVTLQDTLAKTGAAVKWVEEDNLHFTLLFLGEVDQRDLTAVCRAVAGAAAGHAAFPLTVEQVGVFGSIRRPRTIWVGAGTGAAEITALHDALEPPLMELGCYRREARPFTPHLTLGRVNGDRAAEALAAALTKRAAWSAGDTTVADILVMGSELTRDGPRYTVLSRAKLI